MNNLYSIIDEDDNIVLDNFYYWDACNYLSEIMDYEIAEDIWNTMDSKNQNEWIEQFMGMQWYEGSVEDWLSENDPILFFYNESKNEHGADLLLDELSKEQTIELAKKYGFEK